jgi:glycosyltransferase involved in cell wall biosynthesis
LESEVAKLGCPVEVVRISTPFDESGRTYRRYLYWLIRASSFVKEESNCYGIFHHVTFASDWMPPPVIFGVSSPKTVWGPAGGNTYPPAALAAKLGIRELTRCTVRAAGTRTVRMATRAILANRIDSFIAMNVDSLKSAPRGSGTSLYANCVIPYEEYTAHRSVIRGKRVLFVGRLLNLKGIDFAIDSLEYLSEDWTLTIIGDGREMARLKRRSSRYGHRVEFLGWQEHKSVKAYMSESDVLVFPSLHDSGGWSAAEGAACGLPVVCLDLGGVQTMAGENAVVVESKPVVSIAERIARAIEQTQTTAYEPRRDWTMDRLLQKLRRAYGISVNLSE